MADSPLIHARAERVKTQTVTPTPSGASWQNNASSPFEAIRIGDVVYMYGEIKRTGSTWQGDSWDYTGITLPAGLRPTKERLISNGLWTWRISTAGRIEVIRVGAKLEMWAGRGIAFAGAAFVLV